MHAVTKYSNHTKTCIQLNFHIISSNEYATNIMNCDCKDDGQIAKIMNIITKIWMQSQRWMRLQSDENRDYKCDYKGNDCDCKDNECK